MWPNRTLTILVLSLGIFILGACQPIAPPAPSPSPESVVMSLEEALNTGNIEAAMALFADDAVFDFVPREASPGAPYTGKEAIRAWLKNLMALNAEIGLEIRQMDGGNVTTKTVYADDDLRSLGVAPVEGTEAYLIQDGKIQSITFTFSEESLTELQAAIAAAQATEKPIAQSVATGLNGPMGVLVDPDGNVWVIDSGTGGDTEMPFVSPETGEETTTRVGETARVVRVTADGVQSDVAALTSMLIGMEALGGARLAYLDGMVYATTGGWIGGADSDAPPGAAIVVRVEGGKAIPVAGTWALEKSQNPDGFILESHPYGLTAGPDGNLWVADAGANTLLKVDPTTGQVELMAVFDGVPAPMPNPNRGGAMESDPVPTGVTFGQDGSLYVSLLPGFPFLPGSAKVVQVTPDGKVSDYATGLTMLTDLRTGPDGHLYAVQIGAFSEEGPVPNSGAIIRIKAGDGSEVVVGGLSFPTSVAFNAAGDAYVTINGGFSPPGTGEVVRYKGVTRMTGQPVALGAVQVLAEPLKDFVQAQAAGWSEQLTPCLEDSSEGGQGYHYGNFAYVDGEVNVLEPEVLMYEPQQDGELKLVAMEYMVPFAEQPATAEPPSPFGHEFHPNTEVGIWALHLWLWQDNPSGLFAAWSPT